MVFENMLRWFWVLLFSETDKNYRIFHKIFIPSEVLCGFENVPQVRRLGMGCGMGTDFV